MSIFVRRANEEASAYTIVPAARQYGVLLPSRPLFIAHICTDARINGTHTLPVVVGSSNAAAALCRCLLLVPFGRQEYRDAERGTTVPSS